ncbi:hypothetical protein DFR58_12944 [Anaerobacterium chartisolvens]|uniref:Uncharacterized protein n=1 Tax=Anaerobacterium chartisolvens TaxID=1297424 RepID=A0A369AM32_9FIRM|nr:hypothetical protein [Anaerobacterium chartisolvens]RCX10452.1 hypothetical protein DFR58_12944 [Anaerobacterium chartisolvens]
MQQFYTQSHVTTVFVLGILHGFLMGGPANIAAEEQAEGSSRKKQDTQCCKH